MKNKWAFGGKGRKALRKRSNVNESSKISRKFSGSKETRHSRLKGLMHKETGKNVWQEHKFGGHCRGGRPGK